MFYPPAFFDLNLRFAQRVAEVSGLSWSQALLEYTHLYLAFGLGRSFDPLHPLWQEFVTGLETTPDLLDWTVTVYHQQQANLPPFQPPEPVFGCFYYAVWEDGRIRLHFFNPEPQNSPLQHHQAAQRRAELSALVGHVREHVPGARSMVGGSWLYNIAAYRRLYPPEFLATAQHEEPEPQFLAQWGQFLDHAGQIKAQMATQFLANLSHATDLDSALHAFPYPVLRLESPIEVFEEFFRSIGSRDYPAV